MQLTQNRIEKLVCPPGKKDMLVFDDEQQGLGVRVTAKGGKTYIVQYRGPGGLKRRMPIGSFSAISLAAAREAARAIMGDAAKGFDPFADRKQKAIEAQAQGKRDTLTLDALIGQWAKRRLSSRRPSYSIEAPRALRVAFAAQLKAPAAALDAKTVRRVIDTIADAGKATSARLAAAYGGAAYNWAVRRELVACNPFDTIQIERTPARDRVLADDELRAVWVASMSMGAYGAIARMLVLTGQRRNEVAGMTWDEISDDCSTWTIPSSRAKNGVVHIVPLSREAQKLLQATPRSSGLVFSARGGQFSGWSRTKAQLDEKSGVTGWRLHDLRRTTATGLQKLGIRLEVTEAVLNHVSGSKAGIVGVYQRHEWAEEKRAALKAWGVCVAALLEDRERENNIVRLEERASA